MKNKLLGLGVALGVICLTACTGGTFLHEYQDVDLWGWSDDDTITFRLPIITSSGTVAAEIGARYTNTYDFTELIVLGIVECDEQVVQTDTIRIPILRENGARGMKKHSTSPNQSQGKVMWSVNRRERTTIN